MNSDNGHHGRYAGTGSDPIPVTIPQFPLEGDAQRSPSDNGHHGSDPIPVTIPQSPVEDDAMVDDTDNMVTYADIRTIFKNYSKAYSIAYPIQGELVLSRMMAGIDYDDKVICRITNLLLGCQQNNKPYFINFLSGLFDERHDEAHPSYRIVKNLATKNIPKEAKDINDWDACTKYIANLAGKNDKYAKQIKKFLGALEKAGLLTKIMLKCIRSFFKICNKNIKKVEGLIPLQYVPINKVKVLLHLLNQRICSPNKVDLTPRSKMIVLCILSICIFSNRFFEYLLYKYAINTFPSSQDEVNKIIKKREAQQQHIQAKKLQEQPQSAPTLQQEQPQSAPTLQQEQPRSASTDGAAQMPIREEDNIVERILPALDMQKYDTLLKKLANQFLAKTKNANSLIEKATQCVKVLATSSSIIRGTHVDLATEADVCTAKYKSLIDFITSNDEQKVKELIDPTFVRDMQVSLMRDHPVCKERFDKVFEDGERLLEMILSNAEDSERKTIEFNERVNDIQKELTKLWVEVSKTNDEVKNVKEQVDLQKQKMEDLDARHCALTDSHMTITSELNDLKQKSNDTDAKVAENSTRIDEIAQMLKKYMEEQEAAKTKSTRKRDRGAASAMQTSTAKRNKLTTTTAEETAATDAEKAAKKAAADAEKAAKKAAADAEKAAKKAAADAKKAVDDAAKEKKAADAAAKKAAMKPAAKGTRSSQRGNFGVQPKRYFAAPVKSRVKSIASSFANSRIQPTTDADSSSDSDLDAPVKSRVQFTADSDLAAPVKSRVQPTANANSGSGSGSDSDSDSDSDSEQGFWFNPTQYDENQQGQPISEAEIWISKDWKAGKYSDPRCILEYRRFFHLEPDSEKESEDDSNSGNEN